MRGWGGLTSLLEGRLREDAGDLAAAATAFERAAELALRGRVAPERAAALIRLARVRQALGAAESEVQAALRERAAGAVVVRRTGTLIHALAAAERGGAPPRGGDDELSERELGVLRMLARLACARPEFADATFE